MTRRVELVIAAGALLAAMLLASLLTDRGILFSRPLWLDEYHTVLVANRATPVQMVNDLAHGADLAPPLLHLTAWTARHLVGELTPVKLHAMSFLAVWIAAVLVYATLRRRFDVTPSAAGVLALLSNGLVVSHAFEARYYGPWLMLCAFFAWAIGIDASRPRSTRRDWLLAIAAVLLCTIHWFGVLTLALMCAAPLLYHPERSEGSALGRGKLREGSAPIPPGQKSRSLASLGMTRGPLGKDSIRVIAPAGAGFLASLVCSPLLFRQRALFTTPMWVPDLNGAQVVEMGRAFYVTLVPVAAALILLAGTLRERSATPEPAAPSALHDPSIIALCALALMPVVIVLVSWLVQPTMLPRYAIAAALAWAPLVAYAARSLRPVQRGLWLALLVAVAWVNVREEAAARRAFTNDVIADVAAFDQALPAGIPIVFETRHVLYPVAAIRPAQRDSMALLQLPDSLLDAMFPRGSVVEAMQRFFRFERDAVRLHMRAYGFPKLMSVAQLDTLPRFLLLARDASLPRGYKNVELFGRVVFSRYHAVRLREDLTLFTR